ncbi:Abi family protein [Promicromonospora sukumoe]|uniref:Abortive infection bacteriophage resistance protein n=1 Tax=Promicromonospora sukumoe TaxID=88382 RepID=A0A7W3JB29_9MICO|nr:Abi family protein [Promicromonospora sukumoe]MBA8809499.1 abortive infection bacteriophage resistance protein [Promicromonospora sukumoe]
MPNYAKPYLTPAQQAALLARRGTDLVGSDAARALETIGYYRLSAYWYPYRNIDPRQTSRAQRVHRSSAVPDGTPFTQILDLYTFDQRIKMAVMEAIERIEVAVRVQIADVLGRRSPFGQHQAACLDGAFTGRRPGEAASRHERWLDRLREQQRRSSEDFVQHFRTKYSGDLPIWTAIELLDFGAMATLFTGLKRVDRDAVAARLGVVDEHRRGDGSVLANWLRVLNFVRNTCAHHARLWNRHFTEKVRTSALGGMKNLRHLQHISERDRARFYPALAVIWHLMSAIAPGSSWHARTRTVLDGFPADGVVGPADMGFPPGWGRHLRHRPLT